MPCRERRLRFFIAVKKLAREILELWQEERFEFEDVDGMGKEEEASGAERLRTSRWAALARREESGGVRERVSECVRREGGGGRRDQTSRPELARGQAAAGFTLP